MAKATATQKASHRKTPNKRKKPKRVVERIKKVPVVHAYYDLESGVKFKDHSLGMMRVKNGGRKVIAISQDQDLYTNWALTFWHEWMHAVRLELGYSDYADEAQVEGMAHAVMDFITDPNGRALLRNMLQRIPEKS